MLEHSGLEVIEPVSRHSTVNLKALYLRMGTPEGVCAEGVGDKHIIENESAEVWNNATKKFSGISLLLGQ